MHLNVSPYCFCFLVETTIEINPSGRTYSYIGIPFNITCLVPESGYIAWDLYFSNGESLYIDNATYDKLENLNMSISSPSETLSVINFNGTDETVVGVRCQSYNQLRNIIQSDLLHIDRKNYISYAVENLSAYNLQFTHINRIENTTDSFYFFNS